MFMPKEFGSNFIAILSHRFLMQKKSKKNIWSDWVTLAEKHGEGLEQA